jgi:hypothetical protein
MTTGANSFLAYGLLESKQCLVGAEGISNYGG